MTTTPKFSIPDIADQQANAETTHNQAVRLLEAMASRGVIDRDLSTPPGSPSDGDAYIVKATGTGDWSGHDNKVAVYVTDVWKFITPQEGNEVYLQDENVAVIYSGSAWVAQGGWQTLSDAATIAWDTSLGSNATVSITANRAMGSPTNLTTGMFYVIQVVQPPEDEELGYTNVRITWNAIFDFTGGSAANTTNAADAVDQWVFVYDGTKLREVSEKLNLS